MGERGGVAGVLGAGVVVLRVGLGVRVGGGGLVAVVSLVVVGDEAVGVGRVWAESCG